MYVTFSKFATVIRATIVHTQSDPRNWASKCHTTMHPCFRTSMHDISESRWIHAYMLIKTYVRCDDAPTYSSILASMHTCIHTSLQRSFMHPCIDASKLSWMRRCIVAKMHICTKSSTHGYNINAFMHPCIYTSICRWVQSSAHARNNAWMRRSIDACLHTSNNALIHPSTITCKLRMYIHTFIHLLQ